MDAPRHSSPHQRPSPGSAANGHTTAHTSGETSALYGGMWDSLRFRDFRLLWFSNLAANFAMQMQMVARGWLVYAMTQSAMALAWVMLSFMVPQFLFSLVGGVVADRMQKKSIMVIAQTLNSIATVYLATVIISGDVTIWHFVVTGAFNGTVLSFSMPARSAVIPEIVGQDSLANAMALQSMVFNLSRIFGPVIAGVVIAVLAAGDKTSAFGVGVIYYLISALYLTAALCSAAIHYQGAPAHRRDTTPWHDAKEGLVYLRDQKLIQGLLMLGFVPMMFGFTASSLLPAFNHDVVDGGADELGYLMTALGAGALTASLVLARLGDITRKGRTLYIAGGLWAIFLGAFAFSSHMAPAMLFCALMGFASSAFGNLSGTSVQLAITQDIRGRIMSIMMMTHGLMPLGVLPVSAVAEWIGISYALGLAAILLMFSLALINYWYPDLKRIDKGHGDAVLMSDRRRMREQMREQQLSAQAISPEDSLEVMEQTNPGVSPDINPERPTRSAARGP